MSFEIDYKPQTSLQGKESKQMGMFLHLSQLLNLLIPVAGIVAPIVLWQIKKDEIAGLDAHGKMIVNWMISCLIYGVISTVLAFVLVGFIGLFAIAVMGLVFPIIGGVKANNGELWEYPLTIKFLK
jgi:uncharacterized protein